MPSGARTNGPDHVLSSVVEIDSDARGLRESLKRLSALWRELEAGTAQRVRFLLTEVVSRVADPRRRPRGPISVRLDVLAAFVRIEITGPGLLTPYGPADLDGLSFPSWVIEDLAERWGSGPSDDAIWFEVERILQNDHY
jgi:hypothetical protein